MMDLKWALAKQLFYAEQDVFVAKGHSHLVATAIPKPKHEVQVRERNFLGVYLYIYILIYTHMCEGCTLKYS